MPQQAFGFHRSIATADLGCVIVCLSLSNADMTIICNGQTKTIKTSGGTAVWVSVGTDAPVGHPFTGSRIGYSASVSFTGFQGNQNYTYSVAQSGTTYTANIYVAPANDYTDFSIFNNTCDNNTSIGGSAPGYYQYMRQYVESNQLPVPGYTHIDDHFGYVDFALVDDEAGTGHYHISKKAGGTAKGGGAFLQGATPAETKYEYDYALAYFAFFGLLADASNSYVVYGHHVDIIWCSRNLGKLPQLGDHDGGANEMGWDIVSSTSAAFTSAMVLWDLIVTPLVAAEQAVTRNRDVVARHFAKSLGPLRIIATDSITRGSGNAILPLDAGNGPTTVYGNNQIDDCLDAANTNHAFKILLLANSIRYMAITGQGGVTLNKNNALAQNPLADECPTQYARLMTAAGGAPKSLMDNPKTNGVLSTMIAVHGDVHLATVIENKSTAGALPEWFYSINIGTGTGSINFPNGYNLAPGYTHGGSTLKMVSTGAVGGAVSGNHFFGSRFDVRASESPKRIIARSFDRNNSVLWEGQFVHSVGGNGAYPLSAVLGRSAGAIGSGDLT